MNSSPNVAEQQPEPLVNARPLLKFPTQRTGNFWESNRDPIRRIRERARPGVPAYVRTQTRSYPRFPMKFSINIPLGVITPGEFQTMEATAQMASALEK